MNNRDRDTLIALQRLSFELDEYGEEIPDSTGWADLGTEWAAVNYGRGDERRQAAMEQGEQSATFNVLDNELTRSVTLKDRIVADGQNWGIVSSVPGKKRGERDITAVRSL